MKGNGHKRHRVPIVNQEYAEVQIGMTSDEVLTLPGRGRYDSIVPARVVKSDPLGLVVDRYFEDIVIRLARTKRGGPYKVVSIRGYNGDNTREINANPLGG